MKFFNSHACKSHKYCKACRDNLVWRQILILQGMTDKEEFDCPEGITKLTASIAERDAAVKSAVSTDDLTKIVRADRWNRCCG